VKPPFLKVRNLSLVFQTLRGRVFALNGVNLDISEGEVMGLVGESGSGKSTLAMSIVRLLPTGPTRITGGSIHFRDEDLLALNESAMEEIRGAGISMIFQEPLTSLNPIFTIGFQLCESVRIGIERKRAKVATTNESTSPVKGAIEMQAIAWLRRVGIPDPERTFDRYPHELSGGMRQRVMIAIALAAKPLLLLADEPTTALDVTTQAQILRLIRSLVDETKTSVLLISHDLAVVAQIADRVAVMYAGSIAEEASVHTIFEKPLHPYTQALLESFPSWEKDAKRLETISGSAPSLGSAPCGCPFHPRCKYVMDVCKNERLQVKEMGDDHRVSCFLY
jgi:oligopeptide/dipeptide ABC transporter ATP-binding protein